MWELIFIPEAIQDIDKLDGSVRNQILKGIYKVAQNPKVYEEAEKRRKKL